MREHAEYSPDTEDESEQLIEKQAPGYISKRRAYEAARESGDMDLYTQKLKELYAFLTEMKPLDRLSEEEISRLPANVYNLINEARLKNEQAILKTQGLDNGISQEDFEQIADHELAKKVNELNKRMHGQKN